jgi:hypothetical protein
MQLVFEFGSKALGPTIEGIRLVIGTLPYKIECQEKARNANHETTGSLQSAAASLAQGKISAFTLRPQSEAIRYALVLEPHYESHDLSLYLGTIEYLTSDYGRVWDSLLSVPGLVFVCIGYEEGVELNDSHMTAESFPWNQWPLVIGALRKTQDSDGWTVREGPEINSVRKRPNKNGWTK